VARTCPLHEGVGMGGKIKMDKRVGHMTHGRQEMHTEKWEENLKEGACSEDLGVVCLFIFTFHRSKLRYKNFKDIGHIVLNIYLIQNSFLSYMLVIILVVTKQLFLLKYI
jgi:hypothetical protein